MRAKASKDAAVRESDLQCLQRIERMAVNGLRAPDDVDEIDGVAHLRNDRASDDTIEKIGNIL